MAKVPKVARGTGGKDFHEAMIMEGGSVGEVAILTCIFHAL